MTRTVEVWTDVSGIVGPGEGLRTRATVTLPSTPRQGPRPIVCFGFPGGGYSRGYFSIDLSGSSEGGQAGWHAARGWVFVACDHLMVGDSDIPSDPAQLSLDTLAAVNAATVDCVRTMLIDGTLDEGIEPVVDPFCVGLGQSMGGSLLVVQQGQHRSFDAVAVLGTSARHVVPAQEPGTPLVPQPYVARGSSSPMGVSSIGHDLIAFRERQDGLPLTTWVFHYDDVPREVVEADMRSWPLRGDELPRWGSRTVPPVAMSLLTPGVISLEASLIDVPVFAGYGERDLCPRPELEVLSYASTPDFTLYRCARMAHMHNFAGTRHRMWARVHGWAEGIATESRVG